MRYQLLFSSGKGDYQLLEDGTLKQFVYGAYIRNINAARDFLSNQNSEVSITL